MDTTLVLAAPTVCAVAYQAWVSRRIILFADYSRMQRGIQLTLVWLLPVFGALAAHLVMYGLTSKGRQRDKKFIPEDNAMS
jgi:hypothetical protein